MRAILPLLMLIGVLWCGLDFCAPAMAHGHDGGAVIEAAQAPGGDVHDAAPGAPHVGHHHCPLASDLRSDSAIDAPAPAVALLVAHPIVALESRVPAPPTEPPAA